MPLKRRDLVRKVGKFGGWEDEKRGKGGHRLLRRRDPENPNVVLRCSLKFHGTNEDVSDSVVAAIRRRLKLTQEHGVSDDEWNDA